MSLIGPYSSFRKHSLFGRNVLVLPFGMQSHGIWKSRTTDVASWWITEPHFFEYSRLMIFWLPHPYPAQPCTTDKYLFVKLIFGKRLSLSLGPKENLSYMHTVWTALKQYFSNPTNVLSLWGISCYHPPKPIRNGANARTSKMHLCGNASVNQLHIRDYCITRTVQPSGEMLRGKQIGFIGVFDSSNKLRPLHLTIEHFVSSGEIS